jgi:hypothetical protein
MKFTLTIEMGNDAMRTARHLNEALRKVATSVLAYEEDDEEGFAGKVVSSIVRDENGNKVGRWEIA